MRVDFGALLTLARQIEFAANGCWIWTGSADKDGYGDHRSVNFDYSRKVHRAMWTIHYGKIPRDLETDHLCRNRACCNPAHLEMVTHAENMRRLAAAVTHCKHGHAFDAVNTHITPAGTKQCRACGRRAALARYHADPAAAYQRREAYRQAALARETPEDAAKRRAKQAAYSRARKATAKLRLPASRTASARRFDKTPRPQELLGLLLELSACCRAMLGELLLQDLLRYRSQQKAHLPS